jgi:hypothetical protein
VVLLLGRTQKYLSGTFKNVGNQNIFWAGLKKNGPNKREIENIFWACSENVPILYFFLGEGWGVG